MTDPETADITYIEPLTVASVVRLAAGADLYRSAVAAPPMSG